MSRRGAEQSGTKTYSETELGRIFELLNKIRMFSAQSDEFGDWLTSFMTAICEHTGWIIGHAWSYSKESNELQSMQLWTFRDCDRNCEFRKVSEEIKFAPGIGLPGRVFQSRRTDWIADVNVDSNYPRKPYTNKIRIKGGYGCPVIVEGEVVAVIEFYSREIANPDPILIQTLEYVGGLVGPVMERAHRKQKMVELANSLNTRVGSTVGKISEFAASMKHAANETMLLAQNASEQSQNIAGVSASASSEVKSMAAATAELSTSIQSVESDLDDTESVVQMAVAHIESSSKTFGQLQKGADEIGHVLTLINEIADQTKLLALNATIEAARAGEAGRGFSVVAAEVKELATQTANSTTNISERVQEIQKLTLQANEAFDMISETIEKMKSSTTSIAATIEQQQNSTTEIAHNTQCVADHSESASRSVGDIASALETISVSSEDVLDTASNLLEQIVDLRKEIDSFSNLINAA